MTKFSTPNKPSCDGAGNRLSFSKCTEWDNNDPNSCWKSSNKPENIKAWMSCALGSEPTNSSGLGCSPITSGPDELKCAFAQDCFAIIDFDLDKECGKTGIFAVPDIIKKEIPSAIGAFSGNVAKSAFKAAFLSVGADKEPGSLDKVVYALILCIVCCCCSSSIVVALLLSFN